MRNAIDLYLPTRQTLPNAERARLTERHSANITNIVCWGDVRDDSAFAQAGSDFPYQGRKIECWLREASYGEGIINECQHGIIKHDLVTWTVMGFYNHCALSDIHNMVAVDDPSGLLARWKAEVSACHCSPRTSQCASRACYRPSPRLSALLCRAVTELTEVIVGFAILTSTYDASRYMIYSSFSGTYTSGIL